MSIEVKTKEYDPSNPHDRLTVLSADIMEIAAQLARMGNRGGMGAVLHMQWCDEIKIIMGQVRQLQQSRG